LPQLVKSVKQKIKTYKKNETNK